MLQSLRIKNLALLEEVALDFEAGFTAVTGETGAGKSILLGALSLLAGERADKTIIRQGAAACEAEAALFFEDPARIDAVLAGLDLPPCEEGVLILKRSLSRDKAPKITVNGSLAALSTLIELTQLWLARLDRACDVTDIIDNTTGAAIGVVLGVLLLPLVRPWRRPATSGTATAPSGSPRRP